MAKQLEVTLEILREALQGCKRCLDYTGHYIAFLLGQLPEVDFERVAQQYMPQRSASESDLERKIEILWQETEVEFSATELAAIFSVPKDDVDRALNALAEKKKLAITEG